MTARLPKGEFFICIVYSIRIQNAHTLWKKVKILS